VLQEPEPVLQVLVTTPSPLEQGDLRVVGEPEVASMRMMPLLMMSMVVMTREEKKVRMIQPGEHDHGAPY
jgi:hypothetical protein